MARNRKRAAWCIAAWFFTMCGLFGLAMVFDVPFGQFNSWRFMSMYAILLTFGPLVVFCLGKGMGAK